MSHGKNGGPCVKCSSLNATYRCSCRSVEEFYCNKSCQLKDWSRHKRFCVDNPHLRKPYTISEAGSVKMVGTVLSMGKLLPDLAMERFEKGNVEYAEVLYIHLFILWDEYPALKIIHSRMTDVQEYYSEYNRMKKMFSSSLREEQYEVAVTVGEMMISIMVDEPSLLGSESIQVTNLVAQLHLHNGDVVKAFQYNRRASDMYRGFPLSVQTRKNLNSEVGMLYGNGGVNQLLKIKYTYCAIMTKVRGSTDMLREGILEISRIAQSGLGDYVPVEIDELTIVADNIDFENLTTCQECLVQQEDGIGCPCGDALYCDDKCQSAHWPIHRLNCQLGATRAAKANKRIKIEKWASLTESVISGRKRLEFLATCKCMRLLDMVE
jgi:hypothetical protein